MVLSLYVRTVKMSREGGEGSCTNAAATAGAPVDSYEVADTFENSCEAAAASENPDCGGHTWTMDRIVECFLEEERRIP